MYSSRYFLTAIFLLHFVPTVLAQLQKAVSKEQYNIVLFIADDLGMKDIEPYGSKVVKTPNLKKFAKGSMLFTGAFATSPTCSPSRSSIFTGLMPMRNGAHSNHSSVKPGTRSIVQYLQPLGYHVAIGGKLHVGPEEVFPFERIANTNVTEPGFEKKPGLNYDLNLEPVEKWLSEQQPGKPFMLIVADHSPHVVWPEKPAYDAKAVDIPKNHIDTKDTRVSRSRYYTDISKMDNNVGRLLESLEKNGLSKNTIVIFTADQGAQWAFAKWTLYDDGLRTPLIVRWPGVVRAGQRSGALVSLVDLVPTIVEAAGGKAPENIDGQSFLSVLKGNKEAHREYVYAAHTGDGLMNRSPARMVRTVKYKYILNLAPDTIYHTHIDRGKDHDGGREYWDSWREKSFSDQHAAAVLWRYHNHLKEELYNIEADPLELHNLAYDPEYLKILEMYRIKMTEWRNQQEDTATGPEDIPERKKGEKPVAPYIF